MTELEFMDHKTFIMRFCESISKEDLHEILEYRAHMQANEESGEITVPMNIRFLGEKAYLTLKFDFRRER